MLIKFSLYLCVIKLCWEWGLCLDVNTTSGVVRGQTFHVLNTSVNEFLNIPYAEPPVGALRFNKPLPLKEPIKVIILILFCNVIN